MWVLGILVEGSEVGTSFRHAAQDGAIVCVISKPTQDLCYSSGFIRAPNSKKNLVLSGNQEETMEAAVKKNTQPSLRRSILLQRPGNH